MQKKNFNHQKIFSEKVSFLSNFEFLGAHRLSGRQKRQKTSLGSPGDKKAFCAEISEKMAKELQIAILGIQISNFQIKSHILKIWISHFENVIFNLRIGNLDGTNWESKFYLWLF